MTIVTSVVTVFGPVIDPKAWSNQVALKSEYTINLKPVINLNNNSVLQNSDLLGNFVFLNSDSSILYTITYKSRLTQKNCTKKPMLFLASMGKTGLCHDIFFKFSLRPFEVVEVE